MTSPPYTAVYDFELLPSSLGDVLTWNVQTAIRCQELGRDRVDVYICMDERYPVSMYQWDLINAENSWLFFNEVFGAFGTHPNPGDIHVFRNRDKLLAKLREIARSDEQNADALLDYERTVAQREEGDALVGYFTKYVHSHERINEFFRTHARIPLLRPSFGCEPDVAALITRRFAGKRIVAFHMRQRQLDVGYGGEQSYERDSKFLEWYEFLREASAKYPDVQFVALGRLQEKPLELLRLPNVTSLRTFGLGLGHELTLALGSDLFMGTSSGFAALVNFSTVPYFITRMTPASCRAYRIEEGAERLPFATSRQILIYEPETRELLMRLLAQGLRDVPPRNGTGSPALSPAVDVQSWEWERSQWMYRSATTFRFFTSDTYADKEAAFLLLSEMEDARTAVRDGAAARADEILARIERNFPRMCGIFPDFLQLKMALAVANGDRETAHICSERLEFLKSRDRGLPHVPGMAMKFLARYYPVWLRAKYGWRRVRYFWRRRHRIPGKLLSLARKLLLPADGTPARFTTGNKER